MAMRFRCGAGKPVFHGTEIIFTGIGMQQHVYIKGGNSSHNKTLVFIYGGEDGVDVK